MNTLIEQIKKGQETTQRTFFENFGANKIWVTPSKENVETILDIDAFINRSHNLFLISLLEGERGRLENKKMIFVNGYMGDEFQARLKKEGYNLAITDQISHIDEALAYLKTNV